jgi:ubiquinone/menaquinone biosynthesis C-methylase UbiE
MTTNYDPIAAKYKQAKLQPWRTYIESFTFLELLGDLTDKSVMDLACGEGFYTRRVREKGAKRVVGVDLSERMIELARRQEADHHLGIEYLVGDGRALKLTEQFDLVVAAYLLNYARHREELGAMCRSITRCLKPGGRFVTVNTNPGLDFRSAPSYRQYGFETRMAGELQEGTPITWTFFLEDGSFSIENYYLDVAAHEEALRLAGFREIHWHSPRLAPLADSALEPGFWKAFLDYPPVIFAECFT